MNYQISACVLAIDPTHVTYVYPESENIRLFNIANRAMKEMKIEPHTAGHILQIMDFQGIPCEAYLQRINGKGFEIAVHMDVWFKELTAWSLANVGATEILLNYKRLRKNKQNTGFFSSY